MPHADITAALQAVLDEVCADIPPGDTTLRERVAASLRAVAREDDCSLEDLKQVGRRALTRTPTMWR